MRKETRASEVAKEAEASRIVRAADAKDAMQRVLHPHLAVTVALVLASAAGLAWCFLLGGEGHPLSYALYALSAYTLVVVIVALLPLAMKTSIIRDRALENRYVARVAGDKGLQIGASGARSVLFDLAYAAFTLVTGFAYDSGWAVAVALYHVAIAGIGFALARGYMKGRTLQGSARYKQELLLARTCGILLAVLALALTGVMAQMVVNRQAWVYGTIVVITSATFTFVNLGLAIKGAVQARKAQQPLLVAARGTTLSKTLVQLFFLETTMIAVFGAEGAETFRFIMEAITGAVVFLLVVAIVVMLIRYASNRLRSLPE